MSYMDRFAATRKRVLVVHATYDLTFPLEYSLDVLKNFNALNIDYISKVLPCGHYTTGETPLQVHRRLVPRLLRLQILQAPRPNKNRPIPRIARNGKSLISPEIPTSTCYSLYR